MSIRIGQMELVVAEDEGLKGLDSAGRLELKYEFVELRAKGWSLRKIERKLKVSKSALANWDRELEEEIASLKAMELEALYESYFLAKESRIKALGQQLRKIQGELKARGLEGVSTGEAPGVRAQVSRRSPGGAHRDKASQLGRDSRAEGPEIGGRVKHRDSLQRMAGLPIGFEEEILQELELVMAVASEQDMADWREMIQALCGFVGLSWEDVASLPDADLEEAIGPQEYGWRVSAAYHFIMGLGSVYRLKASGDLAGDVDRLKEALLSGLDLDTF